MQVGTKDGLIHGLPNLRDYFAKAIETLGDKLQLSLDAVLLGAQNSFAMICRCPLNQYVSGSVHCSLPALPVLPFCLQIVHKILARNHSVNKLSAMP